MTYKPIYILLVALSTVVLLPELCIAQDTSTAHKSISESDQIYNASKGIVLLVAIGLWVGAVTLIGKYYKRRTLDKMK